MTIGIKNVKFLKTRFLEIIFKNATSDFCIKSCINFINVFLIKRYIKKVIAIRAIASILENKKLFGLRCSN